MWLQGGRNLLSSKLILLLQPNPSSHLIRHAFSAQASSLSSSSASLSIWRRKKEIGKEGLMVAKELKRLQTNPFRLERFMKSNVSRLLKSDLVAVLAEFQRQDLVSLSIKEIHIDEFVTHDLPFEDINKAFDLMREGKCLRYVIHMPK